MQNQPSTFFDDYGGDQAFWSVLIPYAALVTYFSFMSSALFTFCLRCVLSSCLWHGPANIFSLSFCIVKLMDLYYLSSVITMTTFCLEVSSLLGTAKGQEAETLLCCFSVPLCHLKRGTARPYAHQGVTRTKTKDDRQMFQRWSSGCWTAWAFCACSAFPVHLPRHMIPVAVGLKSHRCKFGLTNFPRWDLGLGRKHFFCLR